MAPKTIYLVACVVTKEDHPTLAKNLYISPLFKKTRSLVEALIKQNRGSWYILSAKFYLTAPNTVTPPYSKTLNTMKAKARRAWAKRILKQLGEVVRPGDLVVLFAGVKYREHLIEPLQKMGATVNIPLEGLGIGEQLHLLPKMEAFLNENVAP